MSSYDELLDFLAREENYGLKEAILYGQVSRSFGPVYPLCMHGGPSGPAGMSMLLVLM